MEILKVFKIPENAHYFRAIQNTGMTRPRGAAVTDLARAQKPS